MSKFNVLVVGGPQIWSPFFEDDNLFQVSINRSHWTTLNNELFLYDQNSKIRVDGVLWRLGPLRPDNRHRALLEMIRKTSTPSVNPAEVLLRGYDRLTMLNELREAGLPVVNYEVLLGNNILWSVDRDFPFVVRFGNYHGGYGKTLVRDAHQWADLRDMAYLIEDYITIEDYIQYQRDIRCLIIGDRVYGTERVGLNWKANHITAEVKHIQPPDELVEFTRRAMRHFGADILGLDFVEDLDGNYVLLESNDIPGIREYPDSARTELAGILKSKMGSVNS